MHQQQRTVSYSSPDLDMSQHCSIVWSGVLELLREHETVDLDDADVPFDPDSDTVTASLEKMREEGWIEYHDDAVIRRGNRLRSVLN